MDGGASLLRHPWSRIAWARNGSRCSLFANGHAYAATAELAARLCAQRVLAPPHAPSAAELGLLLALVNDGHLIARKLRGRKP